MNRFVQYLGLFLFAIVLTGCATSVVEEPQSNEEVQPNDETNEENNQGEQLNEQKLVEKLSTNLQVSTNPDEATFVIALKNSSDQDVELTFSSGQQIEIIVTNQQDEEVYKYSNDKMFTEALEMLQVKAGEEIVWEEKWDYKQNGKRVELGEYTVQAYVVPVQVNSQQVKEGLLKAEGKLQVPEENVAFRNIEVSGTAGEYIVKGEARVFEASFMYAVEDGHSYLIEETVVQVNDGAPSWSAFELAISIPKDKLPKNGAVTLSLYERSAKDGSIVNSYSESLEVFN